MRQSVFGKWLVQEEFKARWQLVLVAADHLWREPHQHFSHEYWRRVHLQRSTAVSTVECREEQLGIAGAAIALEPLVDLCSVTLVTHLLGQRFDRVGDQL